ncbi:uncharacterized protein MELLADRAFT_61723 [Melampsora larici-populina 98AG31]|uniref:Uncharacterized protein n=1 Tax=Melampsora larici-populina (strain 98AG31 / pathotype 3-4-7) TaxID=747676 RepID=F4RGB4_MELLP|nr:uncharacterized protein MELLADRAFT_61723 [Melampsora larici-populina 98AG31]EGG08444.1 hypothetical protein MELLADRAFT_61723 [Melampsora larici-populina 98AG31]
MSTHKTNTKKFLLAYLRSSDQLIVRRKKQWGSVKKGWKTTEEVLDAIDDLVNEKPQCRQKWNDWVLKKAKVIVAAQSPPTGSLYININKLDTTFFDRETDVKREATIIKSMNFIHELISFKLGVDKHSGVGMTSDSSGSEEDFNIDSDTGLALHNNFSSKTKLPEDDVYHKSNNKAENTKTRLKADNAKSIKKKIKAAGTLGFLICIDNLDMMERVHTRRLDATSKIFHGTWGYVHYLKPDLLTFVNSEECTVPAFQGFVKSDCEKPVNSGDLLPTQDEQIRWTLTLKNQIAQVLLRYMKSPKKFKKLSILNLSAIDQIKPEIPDIDMLKLMDSSDNGSEGIASLYDEISKQTGLSPEDFSNGLNRYMRPPLQAAYFHNLVDMTVELFEEAVDKVYLAYFSGRATRLARQNGDSKKLQLGPGTDIHRLKETYSLTVGLLKSIGCSFHIWLIQ